MHFHFSFSITNQSDAFSPFFLHRKLLVQYVCFARSPSTSQFSSTCKNFLRFYVKQFLNTRLIR